MSAAKKQAKTSTLEIVYGVPWIEVEFGERDEGWALYLDKSECFNQTKEASARGSGGGSYCGPERPLYATEIPFDSLEPEYQKQLRAGGRSHTDNRWSPKFRGAKMRIE